MYINWVRADNFKSLIDFELQLSKCTCLVGLNGSGKSTVLQLFDFLAQQFRGDLNAWLRLRSWSAGDLNSRLSSKSNIEFTVKLTSMGGQAVEWIASFNRKELRCTREKVLWNQKKLLDVGDGMFAISESSRSEQPINFAYQGSILSQVKETLLPERLIELKTFFLEVQSLDLLSPELLRQRTRESHGTLGSGGQYLSAFLHDLGPEKCARIRTKLQKAYPYLESIDVSSMRSGWKKLQISEMFSKKRLPTEARHISDGFLRMLAVFSHLEEKQGLTLLDEIENGINPELVEFLIDSLVDTPAQILVTTHSPLVLNYLDDEVAKKGVVYLYKDPSGKTRSIRFFDIPSMAEKLKVMGPGEAYEDTILTELFGELSELEQGVS